MTAVPVVCSLQALDLETLMSLCRWRPRGLAYFMQGGGIPEHHVHAEHEVLSKLLDDDHEPLVVGAGGAEHEDVLEAFYARGLVQKQSAESDEELELFGAEADGP